LRQSNLFKCSRIRFLFTVRQCFSLLFSKKLLFDLCYLYFNLNLKQLKFIQLKNYYLIYVYLSVEYFIMTNLHYSYWLWRWF
jgi:hypothetical protein